MFKIFGSCNCEHEPSFSARVVSRNVGKDLPQNTRLGAFERDLLTIVPADTEVSLAVLRYQVVVGRATLIACVIICEFSSMLCLAALLYGPVSQFGQKGTKEESVSVLGLGRLGVRKSMCKA
jgi:hypothetical protein